MSSLRLTRHMLLGGVSVLALPLAAALTPANATGLLPGMALTLEGGGVCPSGEDGSFVTSYQYLVLDPTDSTSFGHSGCSWTGRIGVFQDRPGAVLGFGDFWGVFVRHEDFKTDHISTLDDAFAKYYGNARIDSVGAFDEDRTIVDFEVGKDLGIGSDGSTLRLLGGIRYARYTSTLRAKGSTGLYCGIECVFGYPFSVRAGHSFDGIGPRLGLTGQLPLFGGLFLTGSVSGSLLWGDHEVRLNSSGFGFGAGKFSDSDVVTNAEGEVGVGMPFFTSGKVIVGMRWEGWFEQNQFKDYAVDLVFDCGCAGIDGTFRGKGSLDRNNWGPFVRLNIPLGPAPPP